MGYFLDTYALVEILKGNKKYEKYMDQSMATSIMSLYELYVLVMKDFGKEKADEVHHIFLDIAMPIEDNIIFMASEISIREKISHIDALAYAAARIHDMKLLTSNPRLKDMKNVEFLR